MTSVLADTHAVIWYVVSSPQLSPAAKAAMDSPFQAGDQIYVSTISMVEIAYLVEKRRIPGDFFDRLVQAFGQQTYGFVAIPFTLEMADSLRSIPASLVRDRPDRMIAATAAHLNAPLVTRDQKLQSLSLPTIW